MQPWQGDDNPGHARRVALMAEVEAEFGEPLADTITGLRTQGNTWRTVAGALGVSLGVLVEWRKALGLPLNKHEQTYDPSSRRAPCRSELSAQSLGYVDAPTAIAAMRLDGLTLREIGERLGIHPAYVSDLSPKAVRGIQNCSARGRQVHAVQVRHRKRGGRDHPWSEDNDILFAGR